MTWIIGKPIDGISINGLEYLLDDEGNEKLFPTQEEAIVFLQGSGYSSEDIEDFFVIVNNDDREAKREAKSRGVIIGSGFSPAHAAAYSMNISVKDLEEQHGIVIDSMGEMSSMEISAPFDPSVPINREQRRAEAKRERRRR